MNEHYNPDDRVIEDLSKRQERQEMTAEYERIALDAVIDYVCDAVAMYSSPTEANDIAYRKSARALSNMKLPDVDDWIKHIFNNRVSMIETALAYMQQPPESGKYFAGYDELGCEDAPPGAIYRSISREQESKEEIFHRMYNLALKVPGLVEGMTAMFAVIASEPEKFAAETVKHATPEQASEMFGFAGTVMEWWGGNFKEQEEAANRLYVQHYKILGLLPGE